MIRETTTADRDAVLSLVRDAFSHDGRGGQEEVDIVVATWARGAEVKPIDLVAVEGDAIIGHVLSAVGDLGGREVQAVAPLAVAPAHQNHGVGGALMRDVLARADAAGWPLVVLLGNPKYYGRFGFESSAALDITYEPVGAGSPYFQGRRLREYDPSYTGVFRYCWEE